MKNMAACKPFRRYFLFGASAGRGFRRYFILMRPAGGSLLLPRCGLYAGLPPPSRHSPVMQLPFSSQQAQPLMQPPLLTLRTTLAAIAVTIAASAAAISIVPAFSVKNSITLCLQNFCIYKSLVRRIEPTLQFYLSRI
jgi:hypothetical protein